MTGRWVREEMQEVELHDKRLEARLCKLLDRLAKCSTASIPAACNDRAEMVAAYRFFDNQKVAFESVLAPHIESSYRRVRRQQIALLVQDTTELDVTRPHSEMAGAGPLHNGRRCGAHLHLLHAFTTDGTPLGTLFAEAWTRAARTDRPKTQRSSSQKRVNCARQPVEEKESYRWLTTAQHCRDIQADCPETQLIMLADQESDITAVIDYCRTQGDFDWIVRCDASRVLHEKPRGEASVSVRDALLATAALGERELSIRARHSWGSATVKHRPGKADRRARQVAVSVHAAQVTLHDPRAGHREGVTVNAVLVRETKPNGQDEPIEWLLLTSLPIADRGSVEQVVEYYLQRWMIELFFKVLKSGCKIESRRFEHIDRFLPALALYMIVAWRSLYVCRVSRTFAESPCTIVFTEAEWKSVWLIVHRTQPPKPPPTLMKMTKLVAQLGGYINRRNAAPPGPQTVWLGLQRMYDIATCYLTFGPAAKHKTCV